MQQDLGSNVRQVTTFAPASRTASANGTIVPLSGFNSFALQVLVGAVAAADASNLFAIKFQVGDEADGSDFVDLDAADYVNPKDQSGAAFNMAIDSTAKAGKAFTVGINTGGKLYGRAVSTETGAAEAIFGASVLMGNPTHAPA